MRNEQNKLLDIYFIKTMENKTLDPPPLCLCVQAGVNLRSCSSVVVYRVLFLYFHLFTDSCDYLGFNGFINNQHLYSKITYSCCI